MSSVLRKIINRNLPLLRFMSIATAGVRETRSVPRIVQQLTAHPASIATVTRRYGSHGSMRCCDSPCKPPESRHEPAASNDLAGY